MGPKKQDDIERTYTLTRPPFPSLPFPSLPFPPSLRLSQLVHLVYSSFDDLVTTQQVYKVEAIDNTYVAAANCPTKDPNHIIHMASMALEMQAKIENSNYTVSEGKHLKIKVQIGLHTGDVVGAVVGTKTWSYHLFGDAVNTTSRMCSTAPATEIQMSTPFKEAFEPLVEEFTKKTMHKVRYKNITHRLT